MTARDLTAASLGVLTLALVLAGSQVVALWWLERRYAGRVTG